LEGTGRKRARRSPWSRPGGGCASNPPDVPPLGETTGDPGGRAGGEPPRPRRCPGIFFAGNAEWVNIINRRGKYTERRLRLFTFGMSGNRKTEELLLPARNAPIQELKGEGVGHPV